MARGEMRRVNVTVLVKATSQREAEEITRGRLNEWYVDEKELDPGDAGWPVGSLIHFVVAAESGHRAVAA